METNNIKDRLSQYFINKVSFTTTDIYNLFSKTQPDIKKATVNWRIYHLVQQGALQKIGRGVYTFGKEKPFIPTLSENYQVVSSVLKKQFPLITYSLWHTDVLREFSHHIPGINFFLVEVEQNAIDSVFYTVKETNKNTFRKPSQNIMEDFILDHNNAVIIKSLVSESPLQIIDGIPVPLLEKILVDLYAEKKLFFFLEGNEYINIINNAFNKYTINADSLLRYASRRNKKQEIKSILNQINGNYIIK